jgi:hypothetical protein
VVLSLNSLGEMMRSPDWDDIFVTLLRVAAMPRIENRRPVQSVGNLDGSSQNRSYSFWNLSGCKMARISKCKILPRELGYYAKLNIRN